ncbi:MAG TPA: tRNA 2-selenouridine(34) synthase MnmH [Bacteroidia bacterium]|jgi:tRNA 2-selenouridine synthase|nr:tRNA 2-selenouridine(34) synthase MnmH [Bacteroidia bacterium]
MPKPLLVGDFLSKSAHIPVIDVRSPAEFSHGHIPGAVNIPLFTNEERAEIGTIYKQKGNQKAVIRGIEIIGPKLEGFISDAKKVSDKELLVHCWRGGMRSGSMAWLFESAGIKCETLVGGYKSFRRDVLRSFEQPLNLFVVGGETGSGKTEILRELKNLGEQIVDLEALAHHKGSSYGAIGELPQPTTESFENLLWKEFAQLDRSRRIWIEDESRSIGKVFIPAALWKKKISSPIRRIKVPFEIRVQRLVKDYGNFPKELLHEATARIQKRLGGEATKLALDALERGDLAETVRITLRYYDKAYDFPQSERKYENVEFIETDSGDPAINAKLILGCIK